MTENPIQQIQPKTVNTLRAVIATLVIAVLGVSAYAFDLKNETSKQISVLQSKLDTAKSNDIKNSDLQVVADKTNHDLSELQAKNEALQQQNAELESQLEAFAKQAKICDDIKKHFNIKD